MIFQLPVDDSVTVSAMVTPAEMRSLALSMPGAEEKSHFDQPDFRVKNKIFAGLSRDGKQATLKLPPELQAIVLDADPKTFVPAAGAWGKSGWTQAILARAKKGQLAELVRESWRLVAPKSLVAEADAQSGEPRPKKKKSRRA